MITLITAMIATLTMTVGGAPTSDTRPACQAAIVVVNGDDDVPCNVAPPSRLDVTSVTAFECTEMGGTFEAGTCFDVDF